MEVLRSEAGGQFDPKLVDIFTDLIESGSVEIRHSTPPVREETASEQ